MRFMAVPAAFFSQLAWSWIIIGRLFIADSIHCLEVRLPKKLYTADKSVFDWDDNLSVALKSTADTLLSIIALMTDPL